ncbi:MAG: nickel/cobalt transporter, partial [Aestuariivirgaceae bacterium]
MKLLFAALALLFLAISPLAAGPADGIEAPRPLILAQSKIDPSKLLVRPRTAPPTFWADPTGWINAKQRDFTRSMQTTLRNIRTGDARWTAAWTLMLLSFGYGIFHAAGPGHGKTVISA